MAGAASVAVRRMRPWRTRSSLGRRFYSAVGHRVLFFGTDDFSVATIEQLDEER